MDDEKLIEIVRKYEFIYNLKHPKYMDNIKKEIAWKEIGNQMKQSAVSCKQRWQALRDAYRRALKKRKVKTDQAMKNIKLWKYESEMAFVAPFLERKVQDSIENTNEDKQYTDVDEKQELYNEFESMLLPRTDDPLDNSIATTSKECAEDEPQTKYIKRAKIIKRKRELSPSSVLIEKLLRDKLNPPLTHDALDHFFLNISDTVKKFPPYLQAVAKNKVFCLVSEMELQQLASDSPYECPSFSESNSEVPILSDDCVDQKPEFLHH
ncbi:unnamed protein product [Colias eurytheme]|nr:unnamed protein product [Colias eurytheme]